MATIKAFTDLEQSKKLAEILPLESADMWWSKCTITDFGDGILKVSYAVEPCNISQFRNTREDVPCWGLAALLGLLPNNENISTNISKGGYRISTLEYTNSWFVDYEDETNGLNNCVTSADNPIDACVAMIEKLHELKML
jgi:hypothetical protein